MNQQQIKLNQKIKKRANAKALRDEKEKILNPLKVNLFNVWKKYPKKILWMFVSAFLYNIALTVFLKKAATIASGTSSLAQIITFTLPSTAQYYGLFYVLVNLPLMFVFWRMNPRMFMVLTYYWMLFQIIVQLLFIEYTGRGSNPIVNFINQRITLYNPTATSGYYWDPFGIDSRNISKLFASSNWQSILKGTERIMNNQYHALTSIEDVKLAEYFSNQFFLSDFKIIKSNINHLGSGHAFSVIPYDALNVMPQVLNGTNIHGVNDGSTWPVLVYAIIGGVSEGFASIVAWRQRGSIGGTSVISNYIAYRSKKPVGNVFLMVAICFSSASTIIIGSLEFSGNIIGHVWQSDLFLTRIMGTIAYLLVFSTLVNRFYPKYKKIKIEIYTKRPELIAEQFKKIGYVHPFNIFRGVGGFSHDEFGKLETVALFLEKDLIIEQVKKVDKTAWITTSNINGVSGQFDTSFVD
ncbi:YitT family protein [Mycoplasma enhydrae]|uniref:YitT family protein n=1 Tax=Mycoplasma enhydrae TaxID=2499220 RepID=UPI00197C3D06|nr:YitT family protein [Mycoplasma enhydrae]MBN4089209.1 YitT family protein [Mycoplasma enhydrae]MCV3753653.1 YitT family protein [Mycoplasma enhydrae]